MYTQKYNLKVFERSQVLHMRQLAQHQAWPSASCRDSGYTADKSSWYSSTPWSLSPFKGSPKASRLENLGSHNGAAGEGSGQLSSAGPGLASWEMPVADHKLKCLTAPSNPKSTRLPC